MQGERIRSFIAVDLSPAAHAALVRLKQELAATGAEVRWVRDAGLHCTLKFLGSVEGERLERVREAVGGTLSGFAPIRVRARSLGVFPTPARPRVVWVGLEGDGLREIAGAVEAAVEPLGFAAEKRAFAPHVTMGRVTGRRHWARLAALMKTHADTTFGDTEVTHVVIYRSQPQRQGAVYTALWTIPFADSTVAQR